MDGPSAWSDVAPEVDSIRDEGRLAAVDLLHYHLRRLLVHFAWEPRHPLSRYVFY